MKPNMATSPVVAPALGIRPTNSPYSVPPNNAKISFIIQSSFFLSYWIVNEL